VSTVGNLIDRMKAAAAADGSGKAPNADQVKQLAAQFESMLLVSMLRDMRQSGKWDDGSPEESGLGAETFFETLDVELANYISKVKGFGLADELQKSIGKSVAGSAHGVVPAATPTVNRSVEQNPVEPKPTEQKTVSAESITGGALQFAVAPGSITSSYGWRRDPFTGHARFHRGIDVKAAYGQDVQTAGAGRVVFSGEQRGYGNTVLVEHGDGVQTRYAHLSATVVQVGDTVAAGQVVGRAGRSGRATGTHLHFEVIKNGRPVAPGMAGLSTPPDATAAD
jgi:murein DD-endopeptidase MepM/ murein hydrolase activator NlpD